MNGKKRPGVGSTGNKMSPAFSKPAQPPKSRSKNEQTEMKKMKENTTKSKVAASMGAFPCSKHTIGG
jgi:hypothetical protein